MRVPHKFDLHYVSGYGQRVAVNVINQWLN